MSDVVYRNAAELGDDQLLELYPWPTGRTWVRAMMVQTLDGASAGPDGVSGSISSPADQRVFNAVRRRADVVLIGAETLRAEEYSPMRAKPADIEARLADGQTEAPVLAVVSGSLALPWSLPVWTESTHTPLVLTSSTDAGALAEARAHADVVVLDPLVPASMVAALTERGHRRILCEGGPHLLRDLVAAGLVDEADITIAPLHSGTGRSADTSALSAPAQFRLAHVLEEDSHLMGRYLAVDR